MMIVRRETLRMSRMRKMRKVLLKAEKPKIDQCSDRSEKCRRVLFKAQELLRILKKL